MKKTLLFLGAALLAMTATASPSVFKSQPLNAPAKSIVTLDDEETFTFGYCSGFVGGLGIGQAGYQLAAAIEIPEGMAQMWTGKELKAVNIGFGESVQTTVTVFLTETLTGTPFYTQTATLETNNWNTVELNTPYTIDGKGFFIGYKLITKSASDGPIGIDNVPTNNTLGDNLAVNGAWSHYGPQFGSICIEAVLTGSMESYGAAITDISLPGSLKPGENFTATATILNTGLGNINATTLKMSAAVGNEELQPVTVKLDSRSVTTGQTGTVTISNLKCNEEGIAVPVTLRIDEINGVEIGATLTEYLVCLTEGYPRAVVVEEGTGTWCGWCPRGIVGMNYMKENYEDQGFIGIAVHANGSGADVMQVDSYLPFVYEYIPGFPGAMVNRTLENDLSQSQLISAFNQISALPAIAKVDVWASYDETDPDNIAVSASTTFLGDNPKANYSLAFVITQDNVGPYYQTNYYAGGGYGAMGGWESKSSRVSTIYDEVARDIKDAFGIEGSIPASVAGNTPYEYSTTLPTTNIYNGAIENCTIVALLLNNNSGIIENAAKTRISQASVGAVLGDNTGVEILSANGAIVVNGDYLRCDVYSTDGRAVATANGEQTINAAPGLYIVKVTTSNGVKVGKVIVK